MKANPSNISVKCASKSKVIIMARGKKISCFHFLIEILYVLPLVYISQT